MSAENITKFIKYIGKNIKPSYPIVLVAGAEIIFRPLFTMLDKKSPEETKKYTALREAITEVVAVPTYLACGTLAAKGAKLFKDTQKAAYAKHNLELLGLWSAALFVIPGLCSIAVKPFTEKLFHKHNSNPNNEPQHIDINSRNPIKQSGTIVYTGKAKNSGYASPYANLSKITNIGMRVG